MKEKKLFWYKTESGRKVVLDAIGLLSKADKAIVGEDLWLAQTRFPKGAPIVKALGLGLYEVRSSISGKREYRCIFVYHGDQDALVVVHAFVKKTQKTPLHDLQLAKTRAKEVLTSSME
jgi:phage-related protein